MKIKLGSETPTQLNWLVAKCEGLQVEIHSTEMILARRLKTLSPEEASTLPRPVPYLVIPGKGLAAYSLDWGIAGPIIERERISVISNYHEIKEGWLAESYDGKVQTFGPTPLIAAMRCFVSSRLGDEVDIPEELSHV